MQYSFIDYSGHKRHLPYCIRHQHAALAMSQIATNVNVSPLILIAIFIFLLCIEPIQALFFRAYLFFPVVEELGQKTGLVGNLLGTGQWGGGQQWAAARL